MTSFSASLINLTALLLSSRDISYHAACDVSVIRARKESTRQVHLQNTLVHAHTISRILPSCDTHQGSLTGAVPEPGDFVESRQLYAYPLHKTSKIQFVEYFVIGKPQRLLPAQFVQILTLYLYGIFSSQKCM